MDAEPIEHITEKQLHSTAINMPRSRSAAKAKQA
jgi:hypothetical protein